MSGLRRVYTLTDTILTGLGTRLVCHWRLLPELIQIGFVHEVAQGGCIWKDERMKAAPRVAAHVVTAVGSAYSAHGKRVTNA
jgi:hypothetical protein